ncbi:MAG: secretin N-terminal domain-containing protein [Candidatus Omnitrophota bacterium]|jgi:type IV pilus assembly protein PilQ
MKRICAVFIVLLFSVTSVCYGQEGPGLKDGEAVESTSPGNITMDFKDADINNVLRILSYKSGMNIVAGKDVTGLVTIRLTDVPWEKALDVVLRTYGYTYEREGNVIRVTTTANLENEELVTEVFSLNYANAKNVPQSIEEMLSSRGKVKFDERTNLLIVTDIATNIYKIREVVIKLDAQTRQVMIEAKIIETTLGNSDKMGIEWQTRIVAAGPKIPTTFPFKNDMSTMTGYKYVPIPKPPESTINYDSQGNPIVTQSTADFPTASKGTPSFPFVSASDFTFGTLDLTQFQAVLEFLSSRGDTKIISNPKITVLDNREALITVGQTLNIPTYERNSSTGTMEITGYTEKELGILLKVTPQINAEGCITLYLKPELSSLLRYDQLTAQVQVPVYSVRKAETQLMVKDGQTIAIGGLISENQVDRVTKVPFLGSIPILGAPFRKTEKTTEKTDLLFFVTVNLVKPGATAMDAGVR